MPDGMREVVQTLAQRCCVWSAIRLESAGGTIAHDATIGFEDLLSEVRDQLREDLRIDSILPNQAPPGQSVIIQGDNLEAAEKVFFGDQEVSSDVDGQVPAGDRP